MVLGLTRIAIIVGLFAGVVTILSFVGGHALSTAVQVDPETEETHSGLFGHVHLAGGSVGNGDGTMFITSGEPGYKSQTIVAQGSYHSDGSLAGFTVCQYQYRVYVNGIQIPDLTTPWAQTPTAYPDTQPASFQFSLGAATFTFDGRVTGALRVELWLQYGSGVSRVFPTGCSSTDRFAYDGAQLIDGAGSLHLTPGQSDIFQEGDQVKFDVATGEGRWYVQVVDGTGNVRCDVSPNMGALSLGDHSDPILQNPQNAPGGGHSPTPACANTAIWSGTKNTRMTITIPQGAFVAGGNNVWRVILRNTFIDHAVDQIVTVDRKVLAPEPPTIVISNQQPTVGQPVTLSLTSRANPQGAPVSSFVVYAWYGTTDLIPTQASPNWIARGIVTPATNAGAYGYTAAYSFTVGRADVIKFRAYAIDAQGRPSGSSLTSTDKAALDNSYGTTAPNGTNSNSRGEVDPQGSKDHAAGPQEPSNFVDSSTTLILLLLAIIGAVLAWRFVPGAPIFKSAAVLLIVGVVGWVFLGKLGVV